MILLELFLGFLIVGLFSFGGAYAAIPLIRDVVLLFGWVEEDVLTNMIAISESTPGPIMVNLATYVGCSQAVLEGLKPCIAGIILAMGSYMILRNSILPVFQQPMDLWALLIAVILSVLLFGSKLVFKKKMSPIVLIAISAVLGIAVYGF